MRVEADAQGFGGAASRCQPLASGSLSSRDLDTREWECAPMGMRSGRSVTLRGRLPGGPGFDSRAEERIGKGLAQRSKG